MVSIDLNCDMGESFGAWRMGNDAELMDHVSSINVACGFHAGDATTIRETVQMAANKGIAVGAHPSFPDLQGFGRREMSLSAQEIFDVVMYQVSALHGICKALGVKLHHVKPHGALYNQAARDEKIAASVVSAVKKIDESLIFYGLSGSFLISEAKKIGLQTASEVFADRTYQTDGSLTPRNLPNALIQSTQLSVIQVLQIVQNKTVTAATGEIIPITAETICIHGDGAHAVEFASEINRNLRENGIKIEPILRKEHSFR